MAGLKTAITRMLSEGGFQRAPDFAAIKRRKAALERKESENARIERQKLVQWRSLLMPRVVFCIAVNVTT